ncbi:MAG: rhodanese-like domain-containing protein [Coleofasciculus sp. G1-WW12-02]|uniref:rhodanese-like domain-containing protein n=1 Tax=unclassified Coleofasciculus TaxID=2692782 RepID=UPI0032FE566D
MSDPQTTNPISQAKEKVAEAIPTPASPQQMPESSAQALKSRLQWGEPALTILDVRDRAAFNQARIRGAVPMPMDELTDRAIASLEPQREIYVYGDNDQQSNQAAAKLREAGFVSVSVLKGGLTAWKAISGSTEGPAEQLPSNFGL